ncbi:MAG: hypothetical protein SGBAC_011004 [Bacillariaceae sp.]
MIKFANRNNVTGIRNMSKHPPTPAASEASSRATKRNKPSSSHPKTLGSLLKYMEGMEVIVELKTGKRTRGTLMSADNDMNVTLDKPQNDSPEDGIDLLDTIHIRGSTVRLIQFPDNADLKGTIAAGVEQEKAAVNKYKRGKRK